MHLVDALFFVPLCLTITEKQRTLLTLKSMPTVEIKLPDKKAPSLNRTNKHVFPTPESPINITCELN